MKLKFRMHKDFKYMEKVSKCLEIFFKMNLSNHINYFLQLIPGPAKKITYLPTRDMLDYILVRLQGLSKLLVRIVETSKIAADLLQQKLHTGNFWMITLLSFSMVSRVYVIARYMAKFTCNIYDKIIPFRNKLHNTSSNNFLPQDYILPKDLRHWLNVDWIDEEVKIIEIDDELLSIKFFDLVDEDEDDVEFCKEYIDIKDDDDDDDDGDKDDEVQLTAADIVKKVKKKIDVTVLRGFVDDDVGEVIDLAEESMQTDKSNTEAQNKDTPVEIILDDTDAGEELLAISDTSEIEVIQNTIEESKSTTTNKRKIGIELKNQQSRSKKKKKNSSDGENVSPAKQKQVKKVTKMEVDLSQETKIKKKKRKSNNLLRKAEQESPNKKQKQKESNVKCKCKIKNQLRTKKRKVIKCKLCAK